LVFFKVIFSVDRLAELRIEVILDGLSFSYFLELGVDSSGLDFDNTHWVTLAKGVQILEFFTTNEKLDFAYASVYCVWD
jgi:hypothetical protein